MNRESIDSVLRSLRRVNLQGSFLGQTVAVRFGLSESDIETLEQLIDLGATTAGRLSEITGLTSGAVTRVIDRLEQAMVQHKLSGSMRGTIQDARPLASMSAEATNGHIINLTPTTQ